MEKTKLLQFLTLLVLAFKSSLIASTAYAAESDEQWANAIAEHSTVIAAENFKNMMQLPGFDQEVRESVLKPRPVLQIFVSSSMNKESLKSYAKEAHRYKGVLVFRGLPQGSFRKLTRLVTDISDERDQAAMQIDDEAFSRFGISAVPAIVLSVPATMFAEQTTQFDKVIGHITLKSALEMFASGGDLATSAREYLK